MPLAFSFAHCEIMVFVNGFIKFRKEVWLLQGLAIPKIQLHLICKMYFRVCCRFLGYSNDAWRKKVSFIKKKIICNSLFLILMSRFNKVTWALLPSSLCNCNFSGYITLKLLSIIPQSMCSSMRQKMLHNFIIFVKCFFWRFFIYLLL